MTPAFNYEEYGFPPEVDAMIFDALVEAYTKGQASIVTGLRMAHSGAETAQFSDPAARQWALFGMKHMLGAAEIVQLETVLNTPTLKEM